MSGIALAYLQLNTSFFIALMFIVFFKAFLKEADPMKLANAKLQGDPASCALKLMDCVLTRSEMVKSNPSGVTRSRDPTRQKTIKSLDHEKMKFIDGKLFHCW